jgi:N-acylglucosamine-6-phosphate 2-epimerase
MTTGDITARTVPHGIIASAQIHRTDDPLGDPAAMAAVAASAVLGGAVGIRCGGLGGLAHVRAISAAVAVPIIGLTKRGLSGPDDVNITATVADAIALCEAGADIVAFDATTRRSAASIDEIIAAVHERGRLALADVSNEREGLDAETRGADVIATTLSGYTGATPPDDGPDVRLVETLVARCRVPIVAEGRYSSAGDVRAAFDRGATAVVVGRAATSPLWIVEEIVRAAGFERPQPR